MRLPPALWRSCRVIACETRLRLLWHIMENGELSVNAVRQLAELSQPSASIQLKVLASRGLVVYRREGMQVIYRAEADLAVEFAEELLEALRICYERRISFRTMIRQATAFTHERRVEVVRTLRSGAIAFPELQDKTGMSSSALSRHLDKLERRGFVKRVGGVYKIKAPGGVLGRVLLRLALARSF